MLCRPADSRGLRETDCGVDGTNAQRSAEAPRSSPAAAQRCAEGAGLDGGASDRSTIGRAVHYRGPAIAPLPRINRGRQALGRLSCDPNLHHIDGRDLRRARNRDVDAAAAADFALRHRVAGRTVGDFAERGTALAMTETDLGLLFAPAAGRDRPVRDNGRGWHMPNPHGEPGDLSPRTFCRRRPSVWLFGENPLRGDRSGDRSVARMGMTLSFQQNSATEVLAGLVERVTFQNPDTGFCVLRVRPVASATWSGTRRRLAPASSCRRAGPGSRIERMGCSSAAASSRQARAPHWPASNAISARG